MCAVICTFNGGDKLERSAGGALRQTLLPDRVVVVDNASTSAATSAAVAALAVREPRVKALRLEENFGPAGGFRAGMAWALEQDFDAVWLLDDDSAPDPGCLGALAHELRGDRSALVWPRNIDENGIETRYPAWRGPLLGVELIRAVGTPDPRWVWGCEDTEYFHWRIGHVHGVTARRAPDAVVRYTAENAARKRSSWHYYYLSRNTIEYRLRTQGSHLPPLPRARRVIGPLTALLGQIVLQEDRKALKLRSFARGVMHGIRGTMGKTVEANGP